MTLPFLFAMRRFFWAVCALIVCSTLSLAASDKVLVAGATGSTGLRALQGFMDVGYKPREIRLLTRNSKSPKALSLKTAGFGLVEANLDVPETLQKISKGCSGCYIHSTASDAAVLDTLEVDRARNLRDCLEREGHVHHVVYNSAAAKPSHKVARIAQKHQVEQVFSTGKLSFTSLRANLFMEELWKKYTRPQILSGRYPLPVSFYRKVYMISVRDMGRLAGHVLRTTGNNERQHRTLNVAGDYLTGPDIAKNFQEIQQSRCHYYNPRLMTLKAWWSFRELYEQIRFFQTTREKTDIDSLHKEFLGLLTSFKEFLQETKWQDRNRTFEDFSHVNELEL